MNRQEPRQIISRRNRPAKAPLSREVIVNTALDILSQEGPAGLSLRKVAAALDTGAASLYVYVTNLSELHALMLDQALGAVTLATNQEGNWRERLTTLLSSYVIVLYNRPGLAQLAQRIIPTGPNVLRLIETILSLLLEGGVNPGVAAWAVDLLVLYVTSIAAEQDIRRDKGDDFEQAVRAINASSAAEYPHIHALRAELMSGEGARFGWAVDVILNGVLRTPIPPFTHSDQPSATQSHSKEVIRDT